MKTKHYSFTTIFRSRISQVSILLLLVLALFNSCEQEDVKIGDATISTMQHLTLSDDILEKVTYGPEKFIRSDQEPTVYEVQLNSEEFICHQPPYVLTVVNGEPDGTFRVTSARVLLDGQEIFKQSDFKKKVEELEQTIEITSSSVLQVEINGKPDTYINVYISGEKSICTDFLAYYPFNGNADDESGNNHHGTVFGATLTTDRFGNENSAYDFDGQNDYISLNFDTPNTTEFSVSLWVKMNTLSNQNFYAAYCGPDGDAGLDLRNYNQKMRFSIGDTYNCLERGDKKIADYYEENWNEWINLTGVYKAYEKIAIYINGTLQTEIKDNIPSSFYSRPQYIGTDARDHNLGGKYQMNGKIDDIRIYNRALNVEEINAIYFENLN